jgi:methylenetetrahydrofolate dehydrogenase (NADP+)/methenyltetrahydrofolate cyclohydrolase
MQIIGGKLVSQQRRKQLKIDAAQFEQKNGRRPGLAVVLVGDNPASHVYVKNKIKACHEVGLHSFEVRKPADVSQKELLQVIDALNKNAAVDGILVQLPLPKELDTDAIIEHIDIQKDVDALTVKSQGLLFSGRPLARPCTPGGVIALLKFYKIPIAGQHAVVVGRSSIVGKPMAQLLLQENATVTQCHSQTKNLREFTRTGDIVVVAAGLPEFLGRDDFKKNSVVIDVGIHRISNAEGLTQLTGDVRFAELNDWVQAATPVPGGVGPMTITTLLENTLCLARESVRGLRSS